MPGPPTRFGDREVTEIGPPGPTLHAPRLAIDHLPPGCEIRGCRIQDLCRLRQECSHERYDPGGDLADEIASLLWAAVAQAQLRIQHGQPFGRRSPVGVRSERIAKSKRPQDPA